MSAQIYLITPSDAEPATFVPQLADALAAASVAALFVPRGNLAENAYKALIKAVVPAAQARDCAVLIEGDAVDAPEVALPAFEEQRPKVRREVRAVVRDDGDGDADDHRQGRPAGYVQQLAADRGRHGGHHNQSPRLGPLQ